MTANRCALLLFLFTILFSSLLQADHDEEWYRKESQEINDAYRQYNKYVTEIVQSFAKQMKDELDLYIIGEGGSMHKMVEQISISFNAYSLANMDEARALHLYVMQKLEEMMNSHEKIQPFLAEKPFTYKSIHIGISFEGINGYPSDGTIEYVSNATDSAVPENKNTIFYYVPNYIPGPSIILLREPYEEAVRKAEEAALVFPFTHKTTPFEAAINEIVLEYSSKVWIKRGLECRHIGVNTPNRVDEIAATFYLFHPASQDQAREVAVYIVETLLEMVNQSEAIRPYLISYPLTSDKIKFLLEFTDYKYSPYREGIEKIVLDGNVLSYTHQVPTSIKLLDGDTYYEPELLGHESYPEALKIVKETPFSLFKEIHDMFEMGYRLVLTPKKPN